MARGTVKVDYINCMSCGVCAQTCPFSYLEMKQTDQGNPRKDYPALFKSEKCTGCGLCANACPLDCLMVRKIDGGKKE